MTARPPTDAEIIVGLLPKPIAPIFDDGDASLPSEPSPPLAPAAIENKARKGGGVRKGKKKKERPARRQPWYVALQTALVFGPLDQILRNILSHGVRNITDFHARFQEAAGTVSMKTFREWLLTLDLLKLFETPPLIRLVEPVRHEVATRPIDDSDIIRDATGDVELSELGIKEMVFNPEGMHTLQMDVVSAPQSVVVPPSVAPLSGGAPSGWVPPPDPFAPVVEQNGTPRTFV